MCLYSLPVLRVNIAERDSVARIVASEENSRTKEMNKEGLRAEKSLYCAGEQTSLKLGLAQGFPKQNQPSFSLWSLELT